MDRWSLKISCILILCARFTSGIQCYSCFHIDDLPDGDNYKQYINPQCKNPTPNSITIQRDSNIDAAMQSRSKGDSGAARKRSREFCGSLFGKFFGFNGVLRSKPTEYTTQPNGCYKDAFTFNGINFVGNTCICDTNLCNGRNDLASYDSDTNNNNNNGNYNNNYSCQSSLSSSRGLLAIALLTALGKILRLIS